MQKELSMYGDLYIFYTDDGRSSEKLLLVLFSFKYNGRSMVFMR